MAKNTTAQNTETAQVTFQRMRQIGFTVLDIEIGQTRFLELVKRDTFTKKDGEVLDYVDAVDLQTGEEGRMWLDGSLRYNLEQLGNQFPIKLEIQRLEKTPAMVKDEHGKMSEQMINQYKMWVIA